MAQAAAPLLDSTRNPKPPPSGGGGFTNHFTIVNTLQVKPVSAFLWALDASSLGQRRRKLWRMIASILLAIGPRTISEGL